MDTDRAKQLALTLMRKHLGPKHEAKFRWTHGISRLGFWGDGTLSLSKPIVAANSEAVVRDTILHEIAHGLHSRMKNMGPSVEVEGSFIHTHAHNHVWQRIAKRLGADPSPASKKAKLPPPFYVYECPGCGKRDGYYRKVSDRSCSKCSKGEGYDQRFKLRLLPPGRSLKP